MARLVGAPNRPKDDRAYVCVDTKGSTVRSRKSATHDNHKQRHLLAKWVKTRHLRHRRDFSHITSKQGNHPLRATSRTANNHNSALSKTPQGEDYRVNTQHPPRIPMCYHCGRFGFFYLRRMFAYLRRTADNCPATCSARSLKSFSFSLAKGRASAASTSSSSSTLSSSCIDPNLSGGTPCFRDRSCDKKGNSSTRLEEKGDVGKCGGYNARHRRSRPASPSEGGFRWVRHCGDLGKCGVGYGKGRRTGCKGEQLKSVGSNARRVLGRALTRSR